MNAKQKYRVGAVKRMQRYRL